MKTSLKKLFIPLLSGLIACNFYSCDSDNEHTAIPIAPILKEIKFPSENDITPGQVAQINGLGFAKEDVLYLNDETNNKEKVEVTEVTDSYLKFIVPLEAGGNYSVIIERAGKQTILNGTFKVPFVVPIIDVVLPSNNIPAKGKVEIRGKGFEDGDIATLYASFYPEGVEYNIPLALNDEGAEFTLPEGLYGVNSIMIIRGERKSNIGTITIETNVGDKLGGGVVFWVDAAKAHGYIVNMSNVGTPTEKFGPEVDPSDAAGTSQSIGSGYANTQNIVRKFNTLQSANNWPEWQGVKIAAQLCLDNRVNDGDFAYTDWFLPSREELIEVFKVKSMLAEKGVNIPANNYWTSSEADGNTGWAAYYVNFYEETNIISELCSKSGWTIGVLPIRAY